MTILNILFFLGGTINFRIRSSETEDRWLIDFANEGS